MSITLSNRVKAVKPSPTLAVTARAAAMRAAGKDIVGLGAGEPDMDTPDHINVSAKLSIIDYQAFYNGKRLHSKLGRQSPLQSEQYFYRKAV